MQRQAGHEYLPQLPQYSSAFAARSHSTGPTIANYTLGGRAM